MCTRSATPLLWTATWWSHYQDYVIRADKVVYNRATTELEADGHLQVTGGPNDVLIKATRATCG